MGESLPRPRVVNGAFTAPDPNALTALLPAFRFQQLIGCGAMGAVFRAEQISLGRDVAIKVLPPELSAVESFSTSFKTEARAMAKLTHPNLIGVYDFGEVDHMLFLVMEFIDGNALHKSPKGAKVDPVRAVRIIEGIAQGLGEAHQHKLLHRDIKPSNIMITRQLKPVLGNFGLAAPAGNSGSRVDIVSSGYVAPEVLENFTSASPASDVYSLGAIMHELVTGIEPSPGATPDLIQVPDLQGLRELTGAVLNRDPTQRPLDGGTFALELERWLKSASQVRPSLITAPATPIPATRLPNTSPKLISGVSGGLPLPMLALSGLALAAVALLAFQRGDKENASVVVEKREIRQSSGGSLSRPGIPPKTSVRKQLFSLENHKTEMRNHLTAAANELVLARQKNVVAFQQEVVGKERAWAPYLSQIDQGRGLLPRYLTSGEKFTISPEMCELVNRYAFDHQGQLEYRHLEVIKELHRKSVETLQQEELARPSFLVESKLEWLEWLGADTFKILARPPDGEWVLRFGPEDAGAVHLIFRKGAVVRILDNEERSEGIFSTTKNGELHIIRPGKSGSWTLRWREPWLDGRDQAGRKVRFRRRAFAFESESPLENKGVTHILGKDSSPRGSTPSLQDPELSRLQHLFRDTLQRRLTPWFQAYRGKITQLLEKDGKISSHLERELKRITALDWKSGYLPPHSIVSHSLIPHDLRGDRNRLQTEVPKILAEVQDTYRNLLIDLRDKRLSSGVDPGEIEGELQPFLSMRQIRLKGFYNAHPNDRTWLDSRSLASQIVPAFRGCRSRRVSGYDIEGILQMNSGIYPSSNSRFGGRDLNTYYGRNWPMVIEDIPIYQKAAHLYLVGGLIWDYESSGTEVATIVLNYLDGTASSSLPLVNQHHIADWYSSRSLPKAERVWKGKRRESGRQCAVYEIKLPNPNPEVPIRSITIKSSGKSAAPFFLGISLGDKGIQKKDDPELVEKTGESPMQRADRELRERIERETADRERKRKEEEQRRRKSLQRPR